MNEFNYREASDFIYNDLRMKTYPVAVKFLQNKKKFPEKTRQPSVFMKKKITLCQGLTMARNYGWMVGMAREDFMCTPAAIMFGFTDASEPAASLGELLARVELSRDIECARKEALFANRFEKGEIEAVVFAPLAKTPFQPDTIVFYGNPAQIMRFVQAHSYMTGERIDGHFGGKLECDEYLIGPHKSRLPRVVLPGNGERIFAGTQDDEMVFAIPGKDLGDLVHGLERAGKTIGARYPVTPYMNFEPEFPKAHREMGREVGLF